jgi:DNA topoisomerase-1
LDGKYGPYVSHNKVNATVPKGTDPAQLTVEEAIRLLEERIAKGGGKKKPARKAAAKPAQAKKASGAAQEGEAAKARKPAAKKAAPARKGKTKADAG